MRRRREESMEERFLRTGAVEPAPRKPVPGGRLARSLLAGLLRFTVVVVLAGAASVGIALLIGSYRGSDLASAATWGLYGGGILLIGFAVSTGGRETAWRGELGEELGASPAAGPVYVAVGVALIALGVVTETLLHGQG